MIKKKVYLDIAYEQIENSDLFKFYCIISQTKYDREKERGSSTGNKAKYYVGKIPLDQFEVELESGDADAIIIKYLKDYGLYTGEFRHTKSSNSNNNGSDEVFEYHRQIKSDEINSIKNYFSNLFILAIDDKFNNKKPEIIKQDIDIFTKINKICNNYEKCLNKKLLLKRRNEIFSEILFPELSEHYYDDIISLLKEEKPIIEKIDLYEKLKILRKTQGIPCVPVLSEEKFKELFKIDKIKDKNLEIAVLNLEFYFYLKKLDFENITLLNFSGIRGYNDINKIKKLNLDGLKINIKSIFNITDDMKKFDLIIGNPPYSSGGKDDLHNKIADFSHNLLKENGKMIFLMPISVSYLKSKRSNIYIYNINKIEKNEMDSMFGISSDSIFNHGIFEYNTLENNYIHESVINFNNFKKSRESFLQNVKNYENKIDENVLGIYTSSYVSFYDIDNIKKANKKFCQKLLITSDSLQIIACWEILNTFLAIKNYKKIDITINDLDEKFKKYCLLYYRNRIIKWKEQGKNVDKLLKEINKQLNNEEIIENKKIIEILRSYKEKLEK